MLSSESRSAQRRWSPCKLLIVLDALVIAIASALSSSPAMANCAGTEVNGVCVAPHGPGNLELPVQSLVELQAVQPLQLTVTLTEEMELSVTTPQLTMGGSGNPASQREASLTGLGGTVTSNSGQTIALPANQAVSLELNMEALRSAPFMPDDYLYGVELVFTPTAAGGTVTTYDVDFTGIVAATCLQDGVAGGLLAPSQLNGLNSAGAGAAGAIANLRCNTDMTVTAATTASGTTPAVSEFAHCQVTFDQAVLLDCDGATAALLDSASFPLVMAEVDLDLDAYQAGLLPAGTYNYVVTLTFTP